MSNPGLDKISVKNNQRKIFEKVFKHFDLVEQNENWVVLKRVCKFSTKGYSIESMISDQLRLRL